MSILIDIQQQTPVWVKARIGSATASRAGDWMITGKKEKRKDYKTELVAERRSGRAFNHEVSKAMQWGSETQLLAAAAYEMDQRVFLTDGGYWKHDTIEWFGASPDYTIGNEGLVEVKCHYKPKHHYDYLDGGEVEWEYRWQMYAQLAVTGRDWVDFVSFDPRLAEQDQLYVRRFDRDQSYISAVEVEVRQFLKEVKEMVERLKARK